jgi:hypothetical protein
MGINMWHKDHNQVFPSFCNNNLDVKKVQLKGRGLNWKRYILIQEKHVNWELYGLGNWTIDYQKSLRHKNTKAIGNNQQPWTDYQT